MSEDRSFEHDPATWGEIVNRAMSTEVTPQRAQMRRVGEAMRVVIERLVATKAPAEQLSKAADALAQIAAALEDYPQGPVFDGFAESANAGDPRAFFDNSPVIGLANPLAPPVLMEVADDKVIARVRWGSAYEGPPGSVHGGYVAAAFDEVLGMTQSLGGRPGMTGTLTIRYRKPTPLHTDLVFEGRVDRVEGRKIFTVGTLKHGDVLCAEADGIFISVDVSKFAEMMLTRGKPER